MSVIFKALKKIKNQQFELQHNHNNKKTINKKRNKDIILVSITKIITTFIACIAIVSVLSILIFEYFNTIKYKEFKQKKTYANHLKKKFNHGNNESLSQIKEKKHNEIAEDKRIYDELAKNEIAMNGMAESEIAINEMGKNKTVMNKMAKNEIAAMNKMAKNETVLNGMAKNETAINEMAKNEIAMNEMAKNETAMNEMAKNETAMNGMAKSETSKNETTMNVIAKNETGMNEIINKNIKSLEITFIPANSDLRSSKSNIENKEKKIIRNVDDSPENLKQIINQNNEKNIFTNTQTKKDKETINNNLSYSPKKIISKKNQIVNTDFKINPDKKNIDNKPKILNIFNNKRSHKTNSLPKEQKNFKNIKPTKEKDKTKIISEKNQIKSHDKSKSQINSAVSKIVQQVRTNIIKNNHAKVSKYLKQLENIKGENNIFVLKLKAFWHIKTGEYNIAEKLLQDVLNRNKDDFEAGINMAVIDINQNRISQARERLHNLQQVYPDNSKILNIIKALN